jgi:histidinol dehydrogenase
MPARLDTRDASFENDFAAVLSARREQAEDVDQVVAAILDDVRRRGHAAVLEYTRRFDDAAADADRLLVSKAEIGAAWAECAPATLAALDLAAARIRAFHEHQRPADFDATDGNGVRLGWRWTAIEAVGLYVPGGTAAYPSSVLMNALPARVAGCRRLVMTVPAPGGTLAPLVLAAARIAEIDEVWRIGGAQAIGALAHGTQRIAPVDKIVGPGNAYVAAAKRRVFGRVGIDMVAGPTEVLIVADAANDPSWVAIDLLAQAEHDSAAQSILITDDQSFADTVIAAVEAQLQTLPRRAIAEASWEHNGCIVVVENLDQFEYRGDGSFGAWLFRIAYNQIQQFYRQRHIEVFSLDDLPDLQSDSPSLDQILAQKERFARLRDALATLSPRRQEIVTLKFFGGLRNQEIAEVLDLNERTVASHLSRALDDLQRIYQKEVQP